MLFNQMGIEQDDNIVDLDDRRAPVDPKARVTMSMVLEAALTNNDVAPEPPLAAIRVAHLGAVRTEVEVPTSMDGSRADVA